MRVGIIGAGHGGTAAAEAAAAAGAEVTVLSAEPELPYFRPRLVAMAVGQMKIEELRMHPADWYRAKGIELRLGSPVEEIEAATRSVVSGGRRESFDALVLAPGAEPLLPPFADDVPGSVLPLWTAEDARRICERLKPGARLVVVGGGILGVEAALRGLEQKLEVTVIERAARLMPAQLGPLVADHLAETLRSRGAQVLLGAGVAAVRKLEDGIQVRLDDGRETQGAVALVSIGARKSVRLAEKAGLKVERGIVVDRRLKTSELGVFACGDAIALDGQVRCSAIDAVRQGKVAGANAAGGDLEYRPQLSPLGYKQGDFELNAIGPAEEPGTEVRDVPVAGGRGALLIKGGVLVGVQVIGPKAAFREQERKLGMRV